MKAFSFSPTSHTPSSPKVFSYQTHGKKYVYVSRIFLFFFSQTLKFLNMFQALDLHMFRSLCTHSVLSLWEANPSFLCKGRVSYSRLLWTWKKTAVPRSLSVCFGSFSFVLFSPNSSSCSVNRCCFIPHTFLHLSPQTFSAIRSVQRLCDRCNGDLFGKGSSACSSVTSHCSERLA